MQGLAAQGLDVAQLHVDRVIGEVAFRQHDLVTAEQLKALGLGRGAIAHRIKRGLITAVHQGVYLWGRPAATPDGAALAAVLACGDGAFLTHDAGAALWEIRPAHDGPIDVMVPGRHVRRPGIRWHRSSLLGPCDLRLVRGIPVAAPAWTLLQIAARLTPRCLASALEQAQIKRLVTERSITAVLERAPRHAGAPALRALVEQPAFTRSQAERRLVALLRAAKLPTPAFNARAEGFEVDVLWRPERVVLEFDSYAFHATRVAFERDRRKTAVLTRAGQLVLRTTWSELNDQPYALVARIAEAIACRPYPPPGVTR